MLVSVNERSVRRHRIVTCSTHTLQAEPPYNWHTRQFVMSTPGGDSSSGHTLTLDATGKLPSLAAVVKRNDCIMSALTWSPCFTAPSGRISITGSAAIKPKTNRTQTMFERRWSRPDQNAHKQISKTHGASNALVKFCRNLANTPQQNDNCGCDYHNDTARDVVL